MIPSGFYSFHPGLYFPANKTKNKKKLLAGSHFLKFVCIVRTHLDDCGCIPHALSHPHAPSGTHHSEEKNMKARDGPAQIREVTGG